MRCTECHHVASGEDFETFKKAFPATWDKKKDKEKMDKYNAK